MHILVARIGRVGDTVMMTPALNAILQCYPDAEITIIASPEGKLLLNDFHPGIKQIWTWDRHGIFKAYTDRIRLLRDKFLGQVIVEIAGFHWQRMVTQASAGMDRRL